MVTITTSYKLSHCLLYKGIKKTDKLILPVLILYYRWFFIIIFWEQIFSVQIRNLEICKYLNYR